MAEVEEQAEVLVWVAVVVRAEKSLVAPLVLEQAEAEELPL